MIISSSPVPYQSAYRDVEYSITQITQGEAVEVEIENSDASKIIGLKRIKGETDAIVNVANYIKTQFIVEPNFQEISGIYQTSNRVVNANISIVGCTKPLPIPITASLDDIELYSKLSNAPMKKRISLSEYDEIPFLAPNKNVTVNVKFITTDNNSKTITFQHENLNQQVYIIALNMPELIQSLNQQTFQTDEICDIEVELLSQNDQLFLQKYYVEQSNSKLPRVCWINAKGSVDYYSFIAKGDKEFDIQKERIYDSKGYKTIGATMDKFQTLSSKCENIETLEWIKEILIAPKVWLLENNQFVQIDVVTSKLSIKIDAPNIFEIVIRDNNKIVAQNI